MVLTFVGPVLGESMAAELEELWKKLSFTEEEDESIVLGRNTTEAAITIGKNSVDEGAFL